jgi:hypothetical protein
VKDFFTEWRLIGTSAADIYLLLNFRFLSRDLFEGLLPDPGILREEKHKDQCSNVNIITTELDEISFNFVGFSFVKMEVRE